MNEREKKNLISRLQNTQIAYSEITNIEFLEENKEPHTIDGILMRPLPQRCNVYLKIKPTEESDINVVVSLPLNDWNGRYLGTGNGGAAGSIVMQSIEAGTARGFATANTDMGTSAKEGNLDLYGKKEKLKDFGYRATHLMSVVAKQIIKAFYGCEAEYSYFLGGSTGGQQALMEAQRYPEDYDGIIAFSPAYNRVNLHQAFVWDLLVTCKNPESLFAIEQIGKVKERIIEVFAHKCGGAPGDRFISYPGKAKFSPSDVDNVFSGLGLSDEQLTTLKNIYSFPKVPNSDSEIYTPQPIGCEDALLTLPYIKDGFHLLLGFLQKWVFGPDFDYLNYDFDKDYTKMVELLRADLDATSPDLSAFKANNGKMLLFTGSADCLIPYTDGKNYYESVVKYQGGLDNTTNFFRYFHIPGLGHCSGGPGLQEIGSALGALPSIPLDNEHDALTALMDWVEKGKAPDMFLPVAFEDGDIKKNIDYERPVFPYPYETEYIGGDRKNKTSFRRKLGIGEY